MRLSSRLKAVEVRLQPPAHLPGTVEVHRTDATGSSNRRACELHGPPCSVSIVPVAQPGRYVIVREVPWLGV
jgi:hypothetical protein